MTASTYKMVLTIKNLNSFPQKDNIQIAMKLVDQSFQFPAKEITQIDLQDLTENSEIVVSFMNKETEKQMGDFTVTLTKVQERELLEFDDDFILEEEANSVKCHYSLVLYNKKFIPAKSFASTPKSSETPKIHGIKREKQASKDNFNSLAFSLSQNDKTMFDVQKKINYSSPTGITAPGTNSKKSNIQSKTNSKRKNASEGKNDLFQTAIYNSLLNANKLIDNLTKEKKAIEECLYLNKINNLDNETGEPFKNHFDKVCENREVIELSPSKLRERFEEKEKKLEKLKDKVSPTLVSNKAAKSYECMKNEVEKFTEEYRKQNEYLKLIVLALDSKIKLLSNVEKENELLKLQIRKAEENSEYLNQSIRQGIDQLKAEQINTNNIFNNVMEEKNEIDEKYRDIVKSFENMKQIQVKTYETELHEAKISVVNLEEIRRQLNLSKQRLESKDRSMKEINDNFTSKINDLTKICAEIEIQKEKYFQEKIQLGAEINEIKQKFDIELTKNKQYLNEIENLRTKNKMLKIEESIFETQKEEKTKLENELSENKKLIEDLNSNMEKIKADAINQLHDLDNENKRISEKTKFLDQKILELELKLNEKGNTITTLQKTNFDLKNTVVRLEKQIVMNNEGQKQYRIAKENEDRVTQENQDLKSQVKLLTDQLISQDEKNYELQNTIADYKEQILDKDEYNNNLKKLILDMRDSEGVFVPQAENQKLDRNMSEAISSLNDPTKIKLLFIREGEGVYQFGSKKIYVKIEQDKIYIRVGGGYLTVEEFLEINSPIELEKMLKNNPIRILSKNIAVNNTLAGRCVKEFEKLKNSPLNPKILAQIYGQEPEKN